MNISVLCILCLACIKRLRLEDRGLDIHAKVGRTSGETMHVLMSMCTFIHTSYASKYFPPYSPRLRPPPTKTELCGGYDAFDLYKLTSSDTPMEASASSACSDRAYSQVLLYMTMSFAAVRLLFCCVCASAERVCVSWFVSGDGKGTVRF